MHKLSDSFLPFPAVKTAVGLSRATIYDKISQGAFPAPVKLGRASRWSAAEIAEWMEARRTERQPVAKAA